MYKHIGQGVVGYFWNGGVVNTQAYLQANMNYINFNEYDIKMVKAFATIGNN